MLANLRSYSARATPVTIDEFFHVLAALSPFTPSSNHVGKERLGLAISGGVDSMAMALLCSKLQESESQNVRARIGKTFQFRGFVVDHGVRPGSNEEARAVCHELQKLNIPAEILRIQWPLGLNPSGAQDFESLARSHRYQILGRACRFWRIDSLLTAHHQDDQAETILMRLMNGHRGYGLIGIKPVADIPECFGIHGVNRSGLLDISGESLGSESRSEEVLVEDGGIKLYRPLLGFSKDRLKSTCLDQGVAWFEDATNADPTLTSRNAIRHVLLTKSLPVALQKPRLLALSGQIQRTLDSLNEVAVNAFGENVEVMKFEPRAGTVVVCLGPTNQDTSNRGERKRQKHAALIWIRCLIESVSPEEHTPLSKLPIAQEIIFPELSDTTSQQIAIDAFTIAGVQFQRVDSGRLDVEKSQASRKRHWLVSRQRPYRKTLSKANILFPAYHGVATTPEWEFFDGRYWVRLTNYSSKAVLLRFFRKQDVEPFRNSLDEQMRRRLNHSLKELAPGDIRWTLPVIVELESAKGERVLALPTLGIGLPEYNDLLRVRLRFKKVPASLRKPIEKA